MRSSRRSDSDSQHWLARKHFVSACDAESLISGLLQQARHLTKQQAGAEDLLQDTLLKAFVSFESFREGSNLKAWLHRIMVNTWVDNYRLSQRRPAEQLTEEVAKFQPLDKVAGQSDSAENQVLALLPSEADRALRGLPDDLRATLYYADVQGHPNTEVAKILEIPVGTVGSRLHRGRSLLRDMLRDHYISPRQRFSA